MQAFVGSLVGRGAQKGVFINTSNFAQTARQYAAGIPHKVILMTETNLPHYDFDTGSAFGVFIRSSLRRSIWITSASLKTDTA